MTPTQEIREVSEQYRTQWNRIYAPMRRNLAGTWLRTLGSDRFQFTFDAYGGFHLKCLDTGVDAKGNYTILNRRGDHFLALEQEDQTIHLYRIEKIDTTRLRIVDSNTEKPLDLHRRSIPA